MQFTKGKRWKHLDHYLLIFILENQASKACKDITRFTNWKLRFLGVDDLFRTTGRKSHAVWLSSLVHVGFQLLALTWLDQSKILDIGRTGVRSYVPQKECKWTLQLCIEGLMKQGRTSMYFSRRKQWLDYWCRELEILLCNCICYLLKTLVWHGCIYHGRFILTAVIFSLQWVMEACTEKPVVWTEWNVQSVFP